MVNYVEKCLWMLSVVASDLDEATNIKLWALCCLNVSDRGFIRNS